MESKKKCYACTQCNKEEEHTTNHYGNIYNILCSVCDNLTEWYCNEEVPEGGWVPEPWGRVKLNPNQFPHTGDLGMPTGTTERAVCIARIVYKELEKEGREVSMQDAKDGTPPMWVSNAIAHAAGGEGFVAAAAAVVLIAFTRGELDPKGGTS